MEVCFMFSFNYVYTEAVAMLDEGKVGERLRELRETRVYGYEASMFVPSDPCSLSRR